MVNIQSLGSWAMLLMLPALLLEMEFVRQSCTACGSSSSSRSGSAPAISGGGASELGRRAAPSPVPAPELSSQLAFEQLPATTTDPELQVQGIFQHTLQTVTNPFILDLGMNEARFTLLSATHGARIIAVDPQFSCVRHIEAKLAAAPQLVGRITVLHAAVGPPGGALQMLRTGADVCDPAFGVGGAKQGGGIAKTEAVPFISVQSFLREGQRVHLVKVDTEGAEVQILQQLLPFVHSGQVEQIVVEIMPGNWKHRGSDIDSGTSVLTELQRLSKQALLLYDPTSFAMPGMRQVEPGQVKSGVPHPLYTGFTMADLVQDRLSHDKPPFQGIPHGCNVWFIFDQPQGAVGQLVPS